MYESSQFSFCERNPVLRVSCGPRNVFSTSINFTQETAQSCSSTNFVPHNFSVVVLHPRLKRLFLPHNFLHYLLMIQMFLFFFFKWNSMISALFHENSTMLHVRPQKYMACIQKLRWTTSLCCCQDHESDWLNTSAKKGCCSLSDLSGS